MILPESFYQNDDVLSIGRLLLGKYLTTHIDERFCSGIIVETEAYRGPEDKASHAWNNRRTNRTEVMYKKGGCAYVYLCYGIHNLFNVVTNVAGIPHAVLIRALEPSEGIEIQLSRRGMKKFNKSICAGPGSLSKAMGINTKHSGLSLTEGNIIRIEDKGIKYKPGQIIASPRVGVSYAGEDALLPWRFRVKDNEFVSRAK